MKSNLCMAVVAAAIVSLGTAVRVQGQPTLFGAAHNGPDGVSTLYTIDTATGVAKEVGSIGFQRCSGMDFDASGVLFATCERDDGTDTNVLITVNTDTGAGTEVGPTGIENLELDGEVGFQNETDISFRNSDGALFANLAIFDALGTIDPSNGAASVIGATDLLQRGASLAFSLSDALFQAGDLDLVTLDQSTGSEDTSVPLIFSAPGDNDPRINAMDFHPDTGVLYASHNDGDPFIGRENFLSTIDTTTGVVSIIGQTVDGLDAIAWSPPSSVEPELINDLLEVTGLSTSYSSNTEEGACPGGVFTISATFENSSSNSLSVVFFEIATLTNSNTVIGAVGGTPEGGQGGTVAVNDGALGPGESFTQGFSVCLTSRSRFSFFVDVFGVVD